MTTFALFLVILSALAQSIYSLFLKTSQDKEIFLFVMYLISLVVAVLLGLLLGEPLMLSWRAMSIAFTTAFFYSLFVLCVAKAYSYPVSDFSIIYPLSTTSPIWIPGISWVILGERPTLLAVFGIAVVMFGAFALQHNGSFTRVFRSRIELNEPAIRLALIAAFVYSFGAVADRKGVIIANYFSFIIWTNVFMCLLMGIKIMASSELRVRLLSWQREPIWRLLIAGLTLFVSIWAFRFGLSMSTVAVAVSVRQISAVFGVLIGWLVLNEPCGWGRLKATMVLIMGVVIIRFS